MEHLLGVQAPTYSYTYVAVKTLNILHYESLLFNVRNRTPAYLAFKVFTCSQTIILSS